MVRQTACHAQLVVTLILLEHLRADLALQARIRQVWAWPTQRSIAYHVGLASTSRGWAASLRQNAVHANQEHTRLDMVQ